VGDDLRIIRTRLEAVTESEAMDVADVVRLARLHMSGSGMDIYELWLPRPGSGH